MEFLSIDEWVRRLGAILGKEFTAAQVPEFTARNAILPETLSPYLFYSEDRYTRNLIYKCSRFEVIAICWEVGQKSPPHNHGDQNCWMVAPIGKLRVQNFRVIKRDSIRTRCEVIATDSYDMDADHPALVETEEPVHQVLNLSAFGERATSVHIYSLPYSSCEVYDPERGTYSDVALRYSSEYGKLSRYEEQHV